MKYDDTESDLHLGMAICFLELGELEEAKSVCEKMLKEGYGHYFTVLQVYMTILIQLKNTKKSKAPLKPFWKKISSLRKVQSNFINCLISAGK